MAKQKPKNQRSRRTSIWLDNGLRAVLDKKAEGEGRSLAATIEFYLNKGLGRKQTKAAPNEGTTDAAAPIFG